MTRTAGIDTLRDATSCDAQKKVVGPVCQQATCVAAPAARIGVNTCPTVAQPGRRAVATTVPLDARCVRRNSPRRE